MSVDATLSEDLALGFNNSFAQSGSLVVFGAAGAFLGYAFGKERNGATSALVEFRGTALWFLLLLAIFGLPTLSDAIFGTQLIASMAPMTDLGDVLGQVATVLLGLFAGGTVGLVIARIMSGGPK